MSEEDVDKMYFAIRLVIDRLLYLHKCKHFHNTNNSIIFHASYYAYRETVYILYDIYICI